MSGDTRDTDWDHDIARTGGGLKGQVHGVEELETQQGGWD